MPLTITKHFSQAEDYRQKLNAVCSPLCMPHVTAPLALATILVLSSATGHLGLQPRCVIWSPSKAPVTVTHSLCRHACKSVHVCPCAYARAYARACARACALSSSLCCLPLVGHYIVTKVCSLGKQKNVDIDESNLFLHLR